MQKVTKPAVWLESPEAEVGVVSVESPNTGTFGLLDDAFVTSRYAEEGEEPVVEIHTTEDAWTAPLDELVTVWIP
jgi:hypothetical protein